MIAGRDNRPQDRCARRPAAFVHAAVKKADLPRELARVATAAGSVRKLIEHLESADLNDEGTAFLRALKMQFAEALKST